MKTINDLKEGDVVWVQIKYGTTFRTKEVRKATVRHVVQDDDMVSRLTGFSQSWIRVIEFDGASRIHYSPKDGETDVYLTNSIFNETMVYYTDKNKLISALEKEKMRLLEEVDALIEQVK